MPAEDQQEITTTSSVIYTPREAILNSAKHLKKTITVQGTVVLVDEGLGRVDISHNGAKLILRLPSAGDNESSIAMPQMDEAIVVTGVLRKEQRRTFLLASKLLIVKSSPSE